LSVRISWAPSVAPDVVSYEIQKSLAITGPFTPYTFVSHDLTDPDVYDGTNGVFFFTDFDGTGITYYRLVAIDGSGQRSEPSVPFTADPPAPSPSVVKVDHNYGRLSALTYRTASAVPVEGALVRVFRKADFDLGRTDSALAVTLTNARGEWVNPVYLATGFTYVIQFHKEGLYGPDFAEVVV